MYMLFCGVSPPLDSFLHLEPTPQPQPGVVHTVLSSTLYYLSRPRQHSSLCDICIDHDEFLCLPCFQILNRVLYPSNADADLSKPPRGDAMSPASSTALYHLLLHTKGKAADGMPLVWHAAESLQLAGVLEVGEIVRPHRTQAGSYCLACGMRQYKKTSNLYFTTPLSCYLYSTINTIHALRVRWFKPIRSSWTLDDAMSTSKSTRPT